MKQRLVGAIVLVALAVIFLPMVLDGSGRSRPHGVAIEIPERPQAPANRLDREREVARAAAIAAEPDDTAANGGSTAAADDGEDARDGATGELTPEPESENGAGGASAATVRPADGATDRAAGEQGSATGEASADAGHQAQGPEAWVVQVGSFARETNALVLRDRLREAEFDAFAERAQSGERTVWRVRIGPVATRDEAQQLSKRVTAERGGPALVMTHP